MGNNIISCCHKHKEKIFHYRNKENETILNFYKKHANCAKENINNVVSVMDNNGTDQDWEHSEQFGGYKEVNDFGDIRENIFFDFGSEEISIAMIKNDIFKGIALVKKDIMTIIKFDTVHNIDSIIHNLNAVKEKFENESGLKNISISKN